jgi:hypothetical protein
MKRGFGKEMVSQEVGDATDQDDWDMQRLGKTQQFKVSCALPRTGLNTDQR